MVSITQQESIRAFAEKEIYVCQTALVEELFKKEIFSFDEIINCYRRFNGQLLNPTIRYSCHQNALCLDSETGECESCFEDNRQPQEVYEWWVVSRYLEILLKLHGEPVLSNDYGSWWGRCTTGQAIYMDDIIIEIYNEIIGK